MRTHMEQILYFDLFKAYDWIESSHKFEKTYFTSCVRNMFWVTIGYK